MGQPLHGITSTATTTTAMLSPAQQALCSLRNCLAGPRRRPTSSAGYLATNKIGACARDATGSYSISNTSTTTTPTTWHGSTDKIPMYDGLTDPLLLLSRLQILFRLHHVPEDQQIWYAAFHLTGVAQLWYIRSTKDVPISEWQLLIRGLACDFCPLIYQDTLGDLAPPWHTSTVNDYINFATCMLHINITSELHQINLFIPDLQDELRTTVSQQHPRVMEAATALARA